MGKWTRRAFITTGVLAGGAVAIGIGIRPGNRSGKVKDIIASDGEAVFNIWVKIAPDNLITVFLPHSEMGQGVHTALGQMIAEELDADWDQLKLVEAPAHKEYANYALARGFVAGDADVPPFLDKTVDGVFLTAVKSMNLQITGGSASVRFTGRNALCMAGATTRALLMKAAAEEWQVNVDELTTKDSKIFHKSSGKEANYGDFATKAVEMDPPKDLALKPRSEYSIMGSPVPRIDIPPKVNGTAKFGLDAELPGMKYATVLASPVFGNKVASVNEDAILNEKGVLKVVNLGDAVAVIADGYWQAKTALNKAKIEWTTSENDAVDQEGIFGQYSKDLDNAIANDDLEMDYEKGNNDSDSGSSDNTIEAEYRIPYLAHAAMEPLNCTVWAKGDECEVWCACQNPLGYRAAVAEALDLDDEQVQVTNAFMGGGFGRKSETDIATQAAKIAKEVDYPVKLIWSREEDTRHDVYREANISRFKATLDANGMPSSWTNRFIYKHHPPEATVVPYAIENQLVQYINSPTHIPWGNWRSVDHSMHGFFIESFIDELAAKAGKDAYKFRRDLLQDSPRFAAVLDKAANEAKWGEALPENWGRGIAIHKSFGTIVAQVADIEIVDGVPKVRKVVCAADPGFAVNPNGFTAQMESGIVYGLTAALYGEITIEKGAVKQSNFHDYKMLRMDECPEIETHIINGGDQFGGAGEPATPVIAPALSNAIFDATGRRVRELPMSKYNFRRT